MDINRLIKNGNYFYFKDAPKHTTGVSLNKSSISLSTVGETYQLVATITPSGAIETGVTWSSSDTSIATVDSNGLVTCVTPGTCTITVTTDYGGYTATCAVEQSMPRVVRYLLVGGGGGGGCSAYSPGGGGGGGGIRGCSCYTLMTGCCYGVYIGAGGGNNTNGGNSVFNGIIAYGGGAGGKGLCCTQSTDGCAGGSGGGAGGSKTQHYGGGTYGQGSVGANNFGWGAGGGGGYGEAGCTGGISSGYYGGAGGCGYYSDISGAYYWYASGGSGGGEPGTSGVCGGGCGGYCRSNGGDATTYGSGGGGGGYTGSTSNSWYGGSGCQGIFIVRYPTACGYDITGGCKYTCGDYTIHCFTTVGATQYLCVNG